jgi:hypothetical protein
MPLPKEILNMPVILTTKQVIMLLGHTTLAAGVVHQGGADELADLIVKEALEVAKEVQKQNAEAKMDGLIPMLEELLA